MCPPGYHHNGFVATHALGHMMYGYTLLEPISTLCVVKQRLIYIYIYIYNFLEAHWTPVSNLYDVNFLYRFLPSGDCFYNSFNTSLKRK